MRQVQSNCMVECSTGYHGSWASPPRRRYRDPAFDSGDEEIAPAPRSVSWKGQGLVIRTRNSGGGDVDYHHPYRDYSRNVDRNRNRSSSRPESRSSRAYEDVPRQPREDLYYDSGLPYRDGYYSDRPYRNYRESPFEKGRDFSYDYEPSPANGYRDYYSTQPSFRDERLLDRRNSPYHPEAYNTEANDVKFPVDKETEAFQDNSIWCPKEQSSGTRSFDHLVSSFGQENAVSEPQKLREAEGPVELPPGFDGKAGLSSPEPLKPCERNDRNRSNDRDKRCHFCGTLGHVRAKCPTKAPRLCFICGSPDHLRGKCPSDRRLGGSADFPRGDQPTNSWLPDTVKDKYVKENKCFTCGFSGHPYYNCPQGESRFQRLFNEREDKAKWTILREPFWRYKDADGEMRGPFSLPNLSINLEDGLLPEDIQVVDIYRKLPLVGLRKLLRITASDTLVGLLSCMPEATSFLDEAMDRESCKASCVVALQTKMHFEFLETTARWLFSSFLNEDLQNYLTARKQWGKSAIQHLDDYRDRSSKVPTPHGSNSGVTTSPEANVPDPDFGVDPSYSDPREQPYNGMLAQCEEYLSKSNVENPSLSTSMDAIGTCLHSAVVGAARTGILDVTIGKYLDTWIEKRKRNVEVVPDVVTTNLFAEGGSEDSGSTMFDDYKSNHGDEALSMPTSPQDQKGLAGNDTVRRKSKRLRLKYKGTPVPEETEQDIPERQDEAKAEKTVTEKVVTPKGKADEVLAVKNDGVVADKQDEAVPETKQIDETQAEKEPETHVGTASEKRRCVTTETVFPEDDHRIFQKEKTVKELMLVSVSPPGRKFWRKELLVKFAPGDTVEVPDKKKRPPEPTSDEVSPSVKRSRMVEDEKKQQPVKNVAECVKENRRKRPAASPIVCDDQPRKQKGKQAVDTPVVKARVVRKGQKVTSPKQQDQVTGIVNKADISSGAKSDKPSGVKADKSPEKPSDLKTSEMSPAKPDTASGGLKPAETSKTADKPLVLHIFRKAKKTTEMNAQGAMDSSVASKRTVKLSDLVSGNEVVNI